MDDNIHEICKVKLDVAVLNERQAATAMALVLAEKIAAADKKLIFAILFGIVGWVFAILMLIHK